MAMSLTSRSALRTINDGNNPLKNLQAQKASQSVRTSLFKPTGLQSGPPEFNKKDFSKTALEVHQDPVCSKTRTEVKEKVIAESPQELPEIEKMHICDPEEVMVRRYDEKSESVLRRIRNWGMTCLYPVHDDTDSDTESDDEQVLHHMKTPRIFDDLNMNSFNEDFSDLEVTDFDLDVPLPGLENIPSIDELPIPFLDDSLDIEPNLGTLEVWDTSTPLTMSPSVRHTSHLDDEDSSANHEPNTSL